MAKLLYRNENKDLAQPVNGFAEGRAVNVCMAELIRAFSAGKASKRTEGNHYVWEKPRGKLPAKR